MLCEVVDQAHDLRLAWEAVDGPSALCELSRQVVDVVLVDLSLPGMSGIELVRRLNVEHTGVVTVVVSGHTERTYVSESMRAGARAFVLKGRPQELLDGVRAALNDERYVSPRVDLDA